MPDKLWKTDSGFDSQQGEKEQYQPNSGLDENGNELPNEGKNTGQGVEAALGQDANGNPYSYSWDKQGKEKAVTQYSSDVLNVKQDAQENASTINQNMSQYQEQADMMQYQNNQQAEKVGWTGGYVLDQNRQMDYLKASLNAQMYGAIKLQEYGYDTSLAAARLSYDLNQKAYAQEYYNQAVTNALNEANLTGTYFSAETKDMMGQLAVAQSIINNESSTDEEKTNATKLETAINTWFESNGISKEGIRTLQAWQADQNNELNWQNELWTEYQAALQTSQAAIDENATQYLMYGENDQIVYENGEVKTIDLAGLSNDDLKSYAQSNKGKEQVQSYFNYLSEQIKNNNKTFDSEGKLTSVDKESINKELKELETRYKAVFGDSAELLVDGYKKDANGNYTEVDSEKNKNKTTSKWVAQGSIADDGTVTTSEVVWSGDCTIKNADKLDGTDDDIEFNFGSGIGDGDKNKNYDLDIDWVYNSNDRAFSDSIANWIASYGGIGNLTKKDREAQEAYLNETKANLDKMYPSDTNTVGVVLYRDAVWLRYQGKWGYVQNNAGGSKLKSDLTQYYNGGTPDRWKD